MKFNRTRWAGLAALALMGGLLAPVVTAPAAQADNPSWDTALTLQTSATGITGFALSASVLNYDKTYAASWINDDTPADINIATKIGNGAWTSDAIPAGCATPSSTDLAVLDDTVVIAWTCDDSVQAVVVSTSLWLGLPPTPVTISPSLDTAVSDLSVGMIASDNGNRARDKISPVVFWRGERATDDTVYRATTDDAAAGFTGWNRDDSPVALATGQDIKLGPATNSVLGDRQFIKSSGVAIAWNVDDTVQLSVMGPSFFGTPGNAAPKTAETGVSPNAGTPQAAVYNIFATSTEADSAVAWNNDDSVRIVRSATDGSYTTPLFRVDIAVGPGYQNPIPFVSRPAGPTYPTLVIVDDTQVGAATVQSLQSSDSYVTQVDDTISTSAGTTLTANPLLVATRSGDLNYDVWSAWVSVDVNGMPLVQLASGGLVGFGTVTWEAPGTISGTFDSISALELVGLEVTEVGIVGWVGETAGTHSVQVRTWTTGGPNPNPNPPTPTPTPATPPSAPASAEATAGNGEVTVSWTPPTSQGSFPVTNYQVQSTPSSQGCLVPATATTCRVGGLVDGTEYTFEVRALNGGGWGPWANAGTVTPGPGPDPEASIMITGTRSANDRVARVKGETTGLTGATLQSMVRLSTQTEFTAGSARQVNARGEFTWKRRAKATVGVEVYFTAGDISSNTVTIAGR